MVELAQERSNHKPDPMVEIQFSRGLAVSASQIAKRRGRRSMNRFWSAVGLVIFCAAFAYGATDANISGVVKDPSGAPFRGAFVRAQNVQSKISVNALSDNQGRYRIQNLPPGDYQIGRAH